MSASTSDLGETQLVVDVTSFVWGLRSIQTDASEDSTRMTYILNNDEGSPKF